MFYIILLALYYILFLNTSIINSTNKLIGDSKLFYFYPSILISKFKYGKSIVYIFFSILLVFIFDEVYHLWKKKKHTILKQLEGKKVTQIGGVIMKWKGEILYDNFKEVGEIIFKDGVYNIKHYIEFNDGSIKEINKGLWANSLAWAKRRLNLDSGRVSKDWNWKRID